MTLLVPSLGRRKMSARVRLDVATAGLSVVWLALAAVPMRAQTCANSDLVVRNAKIVVMDDSGRIAEAIAVRATRISAVGTNQEIAACISPSTRVIDAQGRTILPGLIDVHTHGLEWAKGVVPIRLTPLIPR